jgi:hypothetical protein
VLFDLQEVVGTAGGTSTGTSLPVEPRKWQGISLQPCRTPTTLVSGLNFPYAVAVSDGQVYWTDQESNISAVSLTDGSVQNLYSTMFGALFGIAVGP